MRCIELTALGLANRTRRSGSRRITPSPTRGASSNSSSSWRNGNAALGDHRREAVERREVVAARARRGCGRGSATGLAGDHRRPPTPVAHRDALHAGPLARPEHRRIALDDLAACGRRASRGGARPRRRPRRPGPSGRAVWPVVGRTWASTTERLPSSPTTGASSRGRRSRGRRAAATTPRAAGRDAAPRRRARSWCAPARRRWSRGDRTGGTGRDRGLHRCVPTRRCRRCRRRTRARRTTTSDRATVRARSRSSASRSATTS